MKPFIMIIHQSPPEPHVLYRCTYKIVGRDANNLIDNEMQPLTITHIVYLHIIINLKYVSKFFEVKPSQTNIIYISDFFFSTFYTIYYNNAMILYKYYTL